MSDRDAEFLGVVEEVSPSPDAEQAFLRLSHLPRCLFLDSARRDAVLGRFSFIAADPFQFIELPATEADHWGAGGDALQRIRESIVAHPAPTLPGLPPFQGGLAGVFSYELARQLERLPAARFDEFAVPIVAVGLYDVVLAIDHLEDRAWIISQGFPERDKSSRHRRAVDRAQQFKAWLFSTHSSGTIGASGSFVDDRSDLIDEQQLAPQYDVSDRAPIKTARITSDFSPEQYLAAVRHAIEYIHAGDIFQVNLTQRLLCSASDDSVSMYLRLRQRNPATFAGYFDLGQFQIASASPERFCKYAVAESKPDQLREPDVARRARRQIYSRGTNFA